MSRAPLREDRAGEAYDGQGHERSEDGSHLPRRVYSDGSSVSVAQLIRTEPPFRRLWLAQIVSELGDWFHMIALVSMFPTTGGGASVVAGLFIGRNVVAALMTPVAGIVADRFARGRVMIAADLARAAVVLGFLLLRGPEDIALAYVLSFSLEALTILFEPARGAALPQVVPPEKLYDALALSSATWSAMLALGSFLGGTTAALFGPGAAFAINAGSFLLSALLVFRARIPPIPRGTEAREKAEPLRELREGVSYLRAHPAQASLLVLKPGALLTGGVLVVVTVFADRVLPGDRALSMGILLAGRGFGALVMPFVFRRFTGAEPVGLGRAILASFAMSIAGFAGFSLSPNLLLAALALFFAHGGTSMVCTASAQLLQRTVPNRVLGRVLSVELALITIAIASSMALSAWLVEEPSFGPRAAGLALSALLLLPLWSWSRSRALHEETLAVAARSPDA